MGYKFIGRTRGPDKILYYVEDREPFDAFITERCKYQDIFRDRFWKFEWGGGYW